jgi:hypothetical protein
LGFASSRTEFCFYEPGSGAKPASATLGVAAGKKVEENILGFLQSRRKYFWILAKKKYFWILAK